MAGEKIPINRPLVGIISLVCLITAGVLYQFMTDEQFPQRIPVTGALMRVGLLMFAFWLALPSRKRDAAWANVSPWVFVVLILAIVGIAVRPKVAIPLILIMAVFGFIIRPRNKRRPPKY